MRHRTEQIYLVLKRIKYPILGEMENNQAMQTVLQPNKTL